MFFYSCVNMSFFKDNYKLLTLFYFEVISWCSEVLWCPLVRREDVVATLWHFLTHTLNVQGAVKRGWAQTQVLKRETEICDSFISEQRKQLATPTYRKRKEDQKKASSPPRLLILLMLLFWGR